MKKYKRGYPVAILAGFGEDRAVLWKVFSQVVKPEKTITLNGTRKDPKAIYSFHESVIDALRPTLKEGVRSIILSSLPRTNYAQGFLNHVQDHHAWLVQGPRKATFSQMTGAATTLPNVTALTRIPAFSRIIEETTTEETENLLDLLEKRLNAPSREVLVLYSLEEIENQILSPVKPGKPQSEYLLIADTYLSRSRMRYRVQRLMQIAANNGIKTRIVSVDSPAGKRLTQLGGMVCILRLS